MMSQTMPRKLAAGNWKMNGTKASLAELRGLGHPQVDVLICPPSPLIAAASTLGEKDLAIGAQDCHAAPSGAHTGDIAAGMLVDAGATYVILGHSERRADHGETSADTCLKAQAALDAGLRPIICIGETLAQREAGQTLDILSDQLA